MPLIREAKSDLADYLIVLLTKLGGKEMRKSKCYLLKGLIWKLKKYQSTK